MSVPSEAYFPNQESYEKAVLADHDVRGWDDPNQDRPFDKRSAENEAKYDYEHFVEHTPQHLSDVDAKDVCLGSNGERPIPADKVGYFFY